MFKWIWLILFLVAGSLAQGLYDYSKAEENLVSFTTTSDVVYAVGATEGGSTIKDLHIDVYHPNGLDQSLKAAILYIHGGGFTQGDKIQERFNAEYMARRGFVTFSMQYRLQGDNPPNPGIAGAIRAAVVDAKSALRWIYANAGSYNIDTRNIFIGGTSAGAITALLAGVTDPEEYSTDVNGDTIPSTNNPTQPTDVQGVVSFCGSLLGNNSELDANDPALFIFHGTADTIVNYSQAVSLRDKAIEVGVEYEFYPIEGGGHCPSQPAENGKNLRELTFEFLLRNLNTSLPITTGSEFYPYTLSYKQMGDETLFSVAGLKDKEVISLELYTLVGTRIFFQNQESHSGNASFIVKLPQNRDKQIVFFKFKSGSREYLRKLIL